MDLRQIKPERDEDFQDAVLESARNQAKAIVEAAQRARDKELQAARAQCEAADYDVIKAQHERETQRKNAEAVLAARGEVLRYREELVDEVFAEVEKRLEAFASGKDYPAFLQAKLESYKKDINTEDKLIVYIRKEDMPFSGTLTKVLPAAEIKEDDTIHLGGVKLAVGPVLYNETLDEALQEQKQQFYAQSGLKA